MATGARFLPKQYGSVIIRECDAKFLDLTAADVSRNLLDTFLLASPRTALWQNAALIAA